LALGRYITHAAVLLLVLAVSGYASVNRNVDLNLRLGAVNAQGLVMGEGGEVGTVQLGRLSTIVKPVAIPTDVPQSHSAVTYQVKQGESLKDIAGRYRVSVDAIRWSNFSALKNADKDVSSGDKIVIPPVDGVAVTTRDGDSASSLASAYHVDGQTILDFNYLRTSGDSALPTGTQLVIPGGKGPQFEKATPTLRLPSLSSPSSRGAPGFTVASGGAPVTAAVGNRFAFGYCTWYVFNRVPYLPWLGDARVWYGQAQAYGWPTGQSPRSGAIMVTNESGFGHVAYVESVNGDGSWTVSEMNYKGWDQVDTRTIRPGGVPLIGFIYPPGR
jgi:surface antigen/LysM repeat protein